MAFTTAEARAVHCEAGIPVTVVCDRWQPPYEFRNARPQEVGERLDHLEVVRLEVLLSHRYTTDEARQLAMRVRGEAARGQQRPRRTT